MLNNPLDKVPPLKSKTPPKAQYQRKDQELKHFELLYSPRTEYSNFLETEETLFNDLTLNFDPITIKIIKKHFKERLGSLNKVEFISILKNHLLSWHQELPNRELLLIKLLARLFSEIDLNDNGSLEWAEFTNYIIHNSNSASNQNSKNNPAYRLRFYYPIKHKLELNESKEIISYTFYIEKYNLLGVVQEGKSVINFYDANTFKRLKTYIDLKDIQHEIDELEMNELDIRSEEKMKREQLAKMLKFEEQKKEHKHQVNFDMNLRETRNYDRPWMLQTKATNFRTTSATSNEINNDMNMLALKTVSAINNMNNTNNTSNNGNNGNNTRTFFSKTYLQFLPKKKRRVREDEPTPEKVKKQIEKIRNLKGHAHPNKRLTIVSTVFINEYDVLLVSASNNKICAWQYTNGEFKNANTNQDYRIDKNYFKCAILTSNSQQAPIVWDPIQKYLYSGQQDGKIMKWDLTKSKPLDKDELCYSIAREKKQNEIENKNKFVTNKEDILILDRNKLKQQDKIPGREHIKIIREKRDSVSCLCLLGKLQLLAASYLNGHIILWDPLLKDFRKFYFDQETGVYYMSYDSIKNILITGGFDHDIFIYDPYIDNSAIYKLKGHNWSISGITSNEKEAEIISIDILGTIKVWDAQTFLNFQTLNLNESTIDAKKPNDGGKRQKLSSNIKMLYMPKIKKVLIYGNKLMVYETDRAQNPDLADDQIILACYYEKITKSIMSFCLRKIKIWNIFTGKLKQIYEDPMNNEITALAIDKNMKRAFLGDNSGKIKNFNMKNGKLLKELEPHNCEISMIVHSLHLNIVISCSNDNVIKIHDDTELTESEVKKELIINGQIKAIVICDKFARLAIGLASGLIRFYDIEHLRYDSDLRTDSDKKETSDEVTSLAHVENTEIIFASHLSGKCEFIVGPPSAMKFYEITSFTNYDNSNTLSTYEDPTLNSTPIHRIRGIPVTFTEFDFEHKLMFTGDQLGYLKCYDLTELYKMIDYGRQHLRNENDPLITLEVVQAFKEIVINTVWCIQAHNESIKHLHYVDIEPNIIISTSNDLKIRIFDATSGKLKDELRQITCKYKPVPIGIKYQVTDPFKARNEQEPEEHIVMRRDLIGLANQNIEDIENQQISEYSKKVTEYNAKEKLYEHVKGAKLKDNQSNNWELDINVDTVKLKEEEELNKLIDVVKQKEHLIKQTEMIMQKESIYSDSYRPQFVSEMDEEQLQDFSNVLSQKLRQVKLAISKANLSQNKFAAFESEKKRKEQLVKEYKELVKQKFYTQPKRRRKQQQQQQPNIESKTEDNTNININSGVSAVVGDQQQQQPQMHLTTEKSNSNVEYIDDTSIQPGHSSGKEFLQTHSNIIPSFTLSKLPKIPAHTVYNTSTDLHSVKTKMDERKKRIQKYLKFIDEPLELRPIKSVYAVEKKKKTNPDDIFKKNSSECDTGYTEALKACAILARKGRIKHKIKPLEQEQLFLNIYANSQDIEDNNFNI